VNLVRMFGPAGGRQAANTTDGGEPLPKSSKPIEKGTDKPNSGGSYPSGNPGGLHPSGVPIQKPPRIKTGAGI